MTQEIRDLPESSLQRLPSGFPRTVRRTWPGRNQELPPTDVHVSAMKEVTKDT